MGPPQVSLVSDDGTGSAIVGADGALLCGHKYRAREERVITFNMDQVHYKAALILVS